MKKKNLTAILLALVLIVSAVGFVACNDDVPAPEPKRGIIYTTALFSGGLYDSETQTAVWEPFRTEFSIYEDAMNEEGALDLGKIMAVLEPEISRVMALVVDAIMYTPGSILYDLTLDQDGNSYNPNIIPANDYPVDKKGRLMDISYGVFGIYKPFVENISERYGDKYEVSVFNYDWRLSPADAGEKLEKYIADKGYDEVILMSHSMGGPVVNSYLSRSEENRNKTKLYMGFAPATLGSFDALAALTCPLEYMERFLSGFLTEETAEEMNIDMDSIKSTVAPFLDTLGDFLFNNIGLMHLVPSYQFLSSAQYEDGNCGIVVDGKALTTKEEIYDFYLTRDWAYYLDEDGNKIVAGEGDYASPDGYKLKKAAAEIESYYDSLFVDGKLASEYVNSYYVVGTGLSTLTGITYDSETDTYALLTDNGCAKQGDGTVPYYASIGGNTYSSISSDKIYEIEGSGHMDVGAKWDLLKDFIFEKIDALG